MYIMISNYISAALYSQLVHIPGVLWREDHVCRSKPSTHEDTRQLSSRRCSWREPTAETPRNSWKIFKVHKHHRKFYKCLVPACTSIFPLTCSTNVPVFSPSDCRMTECFCDAWWAKPRGSSFLVEPVHETTGSATKAPVVGPLNDDKTSQTCNIFARTHTHM